MLVDPLPIDLVHRRCGPVGAADRLQVVDVEQQFPVAGPSHFVQVDKAGFDDGALGVGGAAECRRASHRRREASPACP